MGTRRDAGCPADQTVAVLRAGDRDEDPLARLPRPVDAVPVAVVGEALLDPVGDPEQGELSQRRKVAGTEVVAERGVDPLRRIDVAVRHPPPDRLGRHVDELDLVGPADDRVGDRLALLHAGDLLDDVVHRLEVLDVQRRDDGDACRQQLLDVLAALRVPGAGDVRVGELVDEGDLRRAREDRVDVHLLERRALVLDHLAGDDLEVADLLGGGRATVRLDEADDDVGAAARDGACPR